MRAHRHRGTAQRQQRPQAPAPETLPCESGEGGLGGHDVGDAPQECELQRKLLISSLSARNRHVHPIICDSFKDWRAKDTRQKMDSNQQPKPSCSSRSLNSYRRGALLAITGMAAGSASKADVEPAESYRPRPRELPPPPPPLPLRAW